MTQHPSLKTSSIGVKFRSVLKRYERIKELFEGEKWTPAKDSIYRLPKLKRVKFKAKKAAKAETAEGAAEPAAGGKAPAGKAPAVKAPAAADKVKAAAPKAPAKK